MKKSSCALAKAGQTLAKIGLKVNLTDPLAEKFARNRNIMNLFDKRPLIGLGAFIAPNATCVGKVLIHSHSSVWYGSVLRGDQACIEVGLYSNIQDRVVINTVPELKSGFTANVEIGDYCSIGHGSLLTSCVIEDFCSVGQGCIISEGCVIERNVIIAPGSVLPVDTFIPSGQLWAGNPAKYIRDLTDDEKKKVKKDAMAISKVQYLHADEFLPYGESYLEAERRDNL